MATSDLMFTPAGDLAARVRGGELSSRELVQASLDRIDALDGPLNAFVEVDGERALAAADEVQPGDTRAFAGVPIAVKANVPVEGLCMNYGSKFLGDYRPSYSAYLVRRLREAGFVIVGITNMPEFGILPTTEPRHTGATRNPWNLDRTPGGSSGGSAAAVAAGLVPLAHGNDGGGSIRIPASCCGLVGLKPSRGRISKGPDLGDAFLVSDGVLTHTVAETAGLLDVLAGYEVGDANWAARPVEAYASSVRRDPGRLRIAITAANPLDVDVDPECVRGMHQAAELLSSLGHEVEEAAPLMPGKDALALFISVFGPAVALGISYGELLAGRPPADDEIEPLSRAIHRQSLETSSVGYLGAVAQLQALSRAIVAFFAEYDLLLTPALAERPLAIGDCTGMGDAPLEDLARSGRFTPFTSLFNVTGQPAISVPIGFGEDGLPTNVQIVGKPLGEDTLLQIAAQIETARPWAHMRPPEFSA
ncbi:MAG TPA: amidase [Solirubrobacteraceae bacterium]|nr:amidase [Solirubrobacteraceae bacterium]